MSTAGTELQELRRPFAVREVQWRIGKRNKDKTRGQALAYVDARTVQKRLDDVLGIRWQCRYSHAANRLVICEIGVLFDGEWLWRADGAGDTDFEAEKGSLSGAFKRAAVRWGVGKYLYALKTEWVELTDEGRRLTRNPELPEWATPEGYDRLMEKDPSS